MRTSITIGATAALTALAVAMPAQAGNTTTWSTIDTGVTNTARPGLWRSGGALDVLWTKGGVGTSGMYRRTFNSAGVGAASVTVLNGWNALAVDPVPRASGTAISGLRGSPGGAGYWDGKAFLADSAGTTVGTLSSGLNAYVGDHDLDILNSTPVYAYSRTDQGKILIHPGLDPAAAGTTTTIGPGPEYEAAAGGCCMYYPSYRWDTWIADAGTGANAESTGWLAWYSNSNDAAEKGWLVRSVDGLPGAPTLGPVQQAPGALTGGGAVSATQRAALVRGAKGGVWFAYPVGYPTPQSIRVWRLGTGTAITYSPGHSVAHVALAADPAGRLWLAYYSQDTDKVYTLRSNAGLTKFGKPAVLGHPLRTGGYLYSTAIDASSRRADVVVNSGTALHHRQSLPALSARGRIVRVKGTKILIAVKVTDAGDPVAGAKVRIGGYPSKITGSSGSVSVAIPKKARLPEKLSGKATKADYYPATFSITVKKRWR